MEKKSLVNSLITTIFLILMITGCGSGGSSSPATTETIVATPNSVSRSETDGVVSVAIIMEQTDATVIHITDGLTIAVPENGVPAGTTFEVSYQPISKQSQEDSNIQTMAALDVETSAQTLDVGAAITVDSNAGVFDKNVQLFIPNYLFPPKTSLIAVIIQGESGTHVLSVNIEDIDSNPVSDLITVTLDGLKVLLDERVIIELFVQRLIYPVLAMSGKNLKAGDLVYRMSDHEQEVEGVQLYDYFPSHVGMYLGSNDPVDLESGEYGNDGYAMVEAVSPKVRVGPYYQESEGFHDSPLFLGARRPLSYYNSSIQGKAAAYALSKTEKEYSDIVNDLDYPNFLYDNVSDNDIYTCVKLTEEAYEHAGVDLINIVQNVIRYPLLQYRMTWPVDVVYVNKQNPLEVGFRALILHEAPILSFHKYRMAIAKKEDIEGLQPGMVFEELTGVLTWPVPVPGTINLKHTVTETFEDMDVTEEQWLTIIVQEDDYQIPPEILDHQPNSEITIEEQSELIFSIKTDNTAQFAQWFINGIYRTIDYGFRGDNCDFHMAETFDVAGSSTVEARIVGDLGDTSFTWRVEVTEQVEPIPDLDETDPTIIRISPEVQSVNITAGKSVQFQAKIQDNIDIKKAVFYVNNVEMVTFLPTVNNLEMTSTILHTFVEEETDAEVRVVAFDEAGNSTSLSWDCTISEPLDITDPVVTMISPDKYSEVEIGERITFEFEVTDDTRIDYVYVYVDGSREETFTPTESGTQMEESIRLSWSDAEENIPVKVEAYDESGNQGTLYWYVDVKEPQTESSPEITDELIMYDDKHLYVSFEGSDSDGDLDVISHYVKNNSGQTISWGQRSFSPTYSEEYSWNAPFDQPSGSYYVDMWARDENDNFKKETHYFTIP